MRSIAFVNASDKIDAVNFDLIVKGLTNWYETVLSKYYPRGDVKFDTYPDIECVPDAPEIELFAFLPTSTVLGALAYHTKIDSKPYFRVCVDDIVLNGGTILGLNGVSHAASHELAEGWVNPAVNTFADDGSGRKYPFEVADGVQSKGYPVNIGGHDVFMSDFVTEDWFDYEPIGTIFNYMNDIKAPFAIASGGYAKTEFNGKIEQLPPDFALLPYKTDEYSRHARIVRHLKKTKVL